MIEPGRHAPIEELAEEFLERLRHGESVDLQEYVDRWPTMEEEIREVFPAMEAMERLKRRKHSQFSYSQLPKRIGDFRVIREIGRGGMGIVYEAVQESLDRRVALKVLPQPMWNDRRLRRFRREARMAAKLHHTNIVPVLGVGEDDGHQYIVMQFIRGVGLDEVIDSLTRLDSPSNGKNAKGVGDAETVDDLNTSAQPIAASLWARDGRTQDSIESKASMTSNAADSGQDRGLSFFKNVARVGAQAAAAIHYAHQQGMTHRDVKPANLLLDEAGNIWVADFGLAIEQEASQSDDVVGTLRYMAPEQLQGDSEPRSDIFSLGLSMYELLTRQPAFDDQQRRRQLIENKRPDSPPPPSSIRSCPRDLETIILKSIAYDAHRRYASAADMASDLEAFIDGRPITARRVSNLERCYRWCQRNRALAAALATTATLLVAIAVTMTVGYYRTQKLANAAQEALKREVRERKRAEATLDISLNALDQVYRRFAPDRLRDTSALAAEQASWGLEAAPTTPADAVMLEQILSVYDRFAEQQGNSHRLLEESARANWRVAEIQRRLGNFQRAVVACRRAIQRYQRLADSAAKPASALASDLASDSSLGSATESAMEGGARARHLELARVNNELGMTRLAMKLPAKAVAAHKQALQHLADAMPPAFRQPLFAARTLDSAISQMVSDVSPNERALLFEMARTDYLLRLAEPLAGRRRAASQLQRAIAILRPMAADEVEQGDARYLLSVCYAAMESDPFGPRTEEALALLEQLACDFPQHADYRFAFVVTSARGDLDSVFQRKRMETRLRQALEYSRALVAQHPNIRDYIQIHAHVLRRLGGLLVRKASTVVERRRKSVLREAESILRLAVDHQTTLADRFPDEPAFRIVLASTQTQLAKHLQKHGNSREAQGCCQRAIRQLYGIQNRSTHQLLAETYSILALAHHDQGQLGDAADAEDNAQFHANAAERAASRP